MKTVVTAMVLALLAGAAMAQEMSGQDFVTEAASGGLFEVRSSEMAIEQAQDAEVRGFAEKMIADHRVANEQISGIASSLGLTVHEEIEGTAGEQMAAVEAASAEGFDAAYLDAQLAAHEEAVSLFERYASEGEAAELVSFAETTLPKLQEHLEMVRGLRAD